jgi:hypothetical protein
MPYLTAIQAKKLKIPKNNLQTILIPRSNTLNNAKSWLQKNGYHISYYRTTPHFYRFMQTNPIIGATYYTKILFNGIELVFQKY